MTDKVIKYIAHNLPQLQYLFLDHLFNVTKSTVDYIAGIYSSNNSSINLYV